jgi:hypothetical protein
MRRQRATLSGVASMTGPNRQRMTGGSGASRLITVEFLASWCPDPSRLSAAGPRWRAPGATALPMRAATCPEPAYQPMIADMQSLMHLAGRGGPAW